MTEASFLLPCKQINKAPRGQSPGLRVGKVDPIQRAPSPPALGRLQVRSCTLWAALRAQAGWLWAQDCKGLAGQEGQSWGPDSVEGKSLKLPNEGTEPASLNSLFIWRAPGTTACTTALGPISSTGHLGLRPSWSLILAFSPASSTLSPTSAPTLRAIPKSFDRTLAPRLPFCLTGMGQCDGGYRKIRWKPALPEPAIVV